MSFGRNILESQVRYGWPTAWSVQNGGVANAILTFGDSNNLTFNGVIQNGGAGTLGITPGGATASVDNIDIIVHGIGGHGAQPQATKDPIVIASQLVIALQTIASRETHPDRDARDAELALQEVVQGEVHRREPDARAEGRAGLHLGEQQHALVDPARHAAGQG